MKHIQPVFQSIFGASWDELPPVMQKHYAAAVGSDPIVVEGWLNVRMSWIIRLCAKLTGILVPYNGDHVPVNVTFTITSKGWFQLDRAFAFPNKSTYHFRSALESVGGDEVIEWMNYGMGWHCSYRWDGRHVILTHKGYVLRFCGKRINLPLAWLLGKGYAEETPIDDDRFAMWTHTKHPLFGEMFRYGGEFRIGKGEKDIEAGN